MSDAEPIRRWRAPDLTGVAEEEAERPMTLDHLADIEAQAREDGFRRGFEAGRAEGLAERQREAERLERLCNALADQTGLLDDALMNQIASLILAVARQFVRRELHFQPGEVVRVVREAASALPASDARIDVHLNPGDAALVNEILHPESAERPWRILEDMNVTRGGARIETSVSSVDATVETRLGAIAARLLSDERVELEDCGTPPGAGDRDRQAAPAEEDRDQEVAPTEAGDRDQEVAPTEVGNRDQEVAPTEVGDRGSDD